MNARLIAGLFAVAACLFIFLAVGPQSLPLVLIWLAACLLIAALWHALPALRLPLAVALLPLCVFLTWEGGLFFVPSAVALVAASGMRRQPTTS